ncbi:MAG: hypothetical protein NVS3B3_06000 [Aquirhabdus sp.]
MKHLEELKAKAQAAIDSPTSGTKYRIYMRASNTRVVLALIEAVEAIPPLLQREWESSGNSEEYCNAKKALASLESKMKG